MAGEWMAILRASGYWTAWLYVSYKFAYPPPDDEKPSDKSVSKAGAAKSKPSGKDKKDAVAKSATEMAEQVSQVAEKVQAKAEQAASSVASQVNDESGSLWDWFTGGKPTESDLANWPRRTGLSEWPESHKEKK